MEAAMKQIILKPFVKYIVLKIDLFESEIIDEANFAIDDEFNIKKYKRKYMDRDDCFIVKVDM